MDDSWYYAEASDRSYGPMTIEELGRILRMRANAVDFLVWHPGMADWGRAGDQFALRKYFSPPPIPSQPIDHALGESAMRVVPDRSLSPPEGKLTGLHPWRRYFARMFDIYIFVVLFFMFLGVTFPRLFATDEKSYDSLFGLIGIAAYVIFEGFWTNVFGASLGKRLYGIRIDRTNGEAITLGASFQRAFAVWLKGLGIGIPIVSLFTLVTAYQTLNREGQTTWDRDFHFRIDHARLSWLRWLFVLLVWLILIALYGFLIALGSKK